MDLACRPSGDASRAQPHRLVLLLVRTDDRGGRQRRGSFGSSASKLELKLGQSEGRQAFIEA